MNEMIDSSADKISPGDETDDRGQIEVANATWSWKENAYAEISSNSARNSARSIRNPTHQIHHGTMDQDAHTDQAVYFPVDA